MFASKSIVSGLCSPFFPLTALYNTNTKQIQEQRLVIYVYGGTSVFRGDVLSKGGIIYTHLITLLKKGVDQVHVHPSPTHVKVMKTLTDPKWWQIA